MKNICIMRSNQGYHDTFQNQLSTFLETKHYLAPIEYIKNRFLHYGSVFLHVRTAQDRIVAKRILKRRNYGPNYKYET